jgi:hypothetical protein
MLNLAALSFFKTPHNFIFLDTHRVSWDFIFLFFKKIIAMSLHLVKPGPRGLVVVVVELVDH